MSTQETAGQWQHTHFCKADGSQIESVEDVAETVAQSAREGERVELFGVTLDDAKDHADGKATVVCYTGNGPNAHNNARVIAHVPQMLAFLRHMLNERDHAFVYSADREYARALLDSAEGKADVSEASR